MKKVLTSFTKRDLIILGLCVFFCVAILVLLSILGTNQTTQTRNSHITPTPFEEPTPTPEVYAIHQIEPFRNTIKRVAPELAKKNDNQEFEDIWCLHPDGIKSLDTISKHSNSYFPKNLLSAVEQIEKEYVPKLATEQDNPEHKPLRGGYTDMCVNQHTNESYVLFYSLPYDYIWLGLLIQPVYAGGGQGPGDPNVAIVHADGTLNVYPKMGTKGKLISISSADLLGDQDTMKTVFYRQGAAYYGCNHIVGVDAKQLYITCGGGDGGAGASALTTVNIKTGIQDDVYLCETGAQKTVCKDQNGIFKK